MSQMIYLRPEVLFAWLFHQTTVQMRVIELQEQIIELQKRIDAMTPKNPADEEVFWHVSSGMMSDDAANSDDAATVRRFRKWNVEFAEKHIKPYVSPKVFSECVNQMTRGLTHRIVELESEPQPDTEENLKLVKKTNNKKSTPKKEKPTQLLLIQ